MKGSLHSLWLLLFKCYSGNRLFIATLDMGIFILRKREVFPPPLPWSTKSIESTLIGSQSFIPRGHLRIVSYNFRQNNVVIYSKRTCLPGQFHSAHDTVCKDFPAQEIGAKTAPLLMATHVLLRYREPVPHVLVQSLHELHRDHLDSEINVVLDC